MATKYVTLKDSNGDILYPQAVATNLAPNSVTPDEIDSRLFNMLIPDGTQITANKDLNTIEFLSVNKYYCSTNATVQTLSNCPTTLGFTMEVYNPLNKNIDNETTDTWVYRLRKITDWQGNIYYQLAYSETTPGVFTYGSWKKSIIGSVSTSDIADSAVTAAKIDPSVLYYRPGDTCQIGSGNGGDYQTGRQRVVGSTKYIWTQFYLDKAIADSVTSMTFTPHYYNECFGTQGLIFSINNPTSSDFTTQCVKGPRPNIVRVTITYKGSGSVSSNYPCCVGLQGTLTFS